MRTEIPAREDIKRLVGWVCGYRAFSGPKYAMIDIINNCDLNCVMCYNHSPLLEKRPDYEAWKSKIMSYDTFALLIDDLAKMKTESVGICGEGEPFFHPDIKKMLSLMSKYKFKIHVITNGMHIDREILDYVVRMKLERLSFSVHAGNSKTYKEIHPLKEEKLFELLKEKLMYLKMRKDSLKSRYPKVTIINVISRLNYNSLSDMIGFALSVGANRICFKPVIVTEGTQKLLSLESQHINSIKTYLETLCREIKLEHNIEEFLDSLTNLNDRNSTGIRLAKNRICYLPWIMANITTEGKVIGCIYQGKDFLDDITNKPFREIWNSKEYIQFRKNKLCPENCLGAAVYPFISTINSINKIVSILKTLKL